MRSLLLLLVTCFVTSNIVAQTYPINVGGSVTGCAGTSTDSDAAAGNYAPGENFVWTVCSDGTGNVITLDFAAGSFDIDPTDILNIYDGNTIGAPLIGSYDNNNPAIAISSTTANTSGCLTLEFISDGAVEASGWSANIICGTFCQPIDAVINATPNFINYGPDSTYTNLCVGDTLNITAAGGYPHNGINPVNYAQSDATSTFEWNMGDGTQLIGQSVSHTYSVNTGYLVTLKVTDANGCFEYFYHRIRIGLIPSFGDLTMDADSICFGETNTLHGGFNSSSSSTPGASPNPGWISAGGSVSGMTFLPDGSGVAYSTQINLAGFPAQNIAAGTDISQVCVNMEHSYIGDLTIELTCPTGTTLMLSSTFGGAGFGNTFLGDALDDGSLTPGVGFDYCWDMTAAWGTMDQENVLNNWIPATISPVNNVLTPGTFQPDANFNAFVGCPIDGNWTLTITDNIGADNGYIFEWSILINPAINPNSEVYNVALVDGVWQPDPTIIATSDSSITVQPTASGTNLYTFTVTDEFGCTYDTTMAFYTLPEIMAGADPDTTICPADSAQLMASNANPAYFWTCDLTIDMTDTWGDGWNNGYLAFWDGATQVDSCTLSTGMNGNTTVSVPSGTTITITYVGGVFDSEVGYTVYDPQGNPILTVVSPNASPGTMWTGTVSCADPSNYTVTWSPAAGLSDPNIMDPVFTGTSTTEYIVAMSWPGFPACISYDTVLVTVEDTLAVPTVSGLDELCAGESVTLTVANGLNVLWPNSSNATSATWTPTGDTIVEVAVTNVCGSYTLNHQITVNPLPTPSTIGDTTIPVESSVMLTTSNGSSWFWSPANGLDCITCQDPIATPGLTTTYIVEVTDSNGCKSTDTVTVNVEYLPIFIPSGFSPNGDGQNDVFYVRGTGISGFVMNVFDRWGNLVFQTTDKAIGWDGTYEGRAVNAGVYVYDLRGILFNSEPLIMRGNITVFR